jgi:hypothetical protein
MNNPAIEETFPVGAILIPDKENYRIAVWLTEDNLILYFRSPELKITTNKRALPYLVDALIELQNR